MNEVIVKFYSCYERTYKRIYKDILKRIYGDINIVKNAKVEIIDISKDEKGNKRNIQSQRSINDIVARTIRIYEDNKLMHIVGISNTNYDYDRKYEFDRGESNKEIDKFGGDDYHANTYFQQGINKIFNYYFENKEEGADLTFYLLDIDEERTYPHNLYNILTYRELETIGFKILNIDKIDFTKYAEECKSQLSYNTIKFVSFNKYLRDIAYISKRNKGNIPSFLQCNEISESNEDGTENYIIEKYIYTFKSLSAQGYESMIRCWCLKVLADNEKTQIEFRLGKQYFVYEEETRKIADKLTQPIIEILKKVGIEIQDISDETFMNEKKQADNVYERYKEKNLLRNQILFRNNIRKKGIPLECSACGEENATILDAAHIYEVNQVKDADAKEINNFINSNHLDYLIDSDSEHKNELFYKKYSIVNSGENGIWLCKNHHGLFDDNFYIFDSKNGRILIKFDNKQTRDSFLKTIKDDCTLSERVFTTATQAFLRQRMMYLNMDEYENQEMSI